jgi:Glycosyl transferase family 2
MPSIPSHHVPLVSVVTATFNRSRAVRCAAESVRAQTLTDWEQWVIGDACTDDTADVVAGFGDPRVRFHNLPENVGEQSGPNNEGLKRARGRYLAMLNHDDLWLPDHLELAVAALEASGADLVFTMALQVEREGHYVLHNWAPGRRYLPELFIPASSWVFRRELFERIGGWRPVQTIRNFPSQERGPVGVPALDHRRLPAKPDEGQLLSGQPGRGAGDVARAHPAPSGDPLGIDVAGPSPASTGDGGSQNGRSGPVG